MLDYSANAGSAKARTMFGKRVKKEDYEALLRCKTVGEIAAYLKSHTNYREALVSIDENTIHRGHLESILQQSVVHDISKLIRYENTGIISEYILMKSAIDQMIRFFIYFASGKHDEYIFELPPHMLKHSAVDFVALSKAKSREELLAVLRQSPYGRIAEQHFPAGEEQIDFAGLEAALYSYMYDRIFKLIDNKAPPASKKELNYLFGLRVDLLNIVHIIRLKYFGVHSEDKIRRYMIPYYHMLTKKIVKALIECESAEEAVSFLQSVPVIKKLGKWDYLYIDQMVHKLVYGSAAFRIRKSSSPFVVMMSYIGLKEIECGNIISIIEGIRYQIPTKDIESLITTGR